ncbi:MAG TPA: histidine kinase [Saprospiraceae bacterium]|nr:histidine kinase [Saprospiraceae bacterium]HMQ82414.1 histidine kinase [Saprospiraceae bacterium]
MSRNRVLLHIGFWLLFVALYVAIQMLFAAPSDLAYPPLQRAGRFLLSELILLPWKIIPFYFLFYYLIPKYLQRGAYWQLTLSFLAIIIICLFGYRSMVRPLMQLMYGETPDFNVYDFKRWLYSLTDIIPAVGLASTVKLLRGRIASQQKEQALQREKLASELNFLKAQVNPHFLFNTLNNLYGLSRKKDENTSRYILKLANMMRYVLQECSKDFIPIAKEVELINAYIELEQLRFDERLQVGFVQNLDQDQQEMAPMILLPFVENAFKHGIEETRFESIIDIELLLKEGHLTFTVENTCDAEGKDVPQGTGLSNVRRQLELIYGKKHHLQVEARATSFRIELQIDLNPDDKR